MTAYSVTPVDSRDREHGVVVELPSRAELVDDVVQLSAQLAAARADAEVWHNAWACAVNNRIEDRQKLSRAMRVLASLGRLSPRMAGLVAAARREVWGDLP